MFHMNLKTGGVSKCFKGYEYKKCPFYSTDPINHFHTFQEAKEAALNYTPVKEPLEVIADKAREMLEGEALEHLEARLKEEATAHRSYRRINAKYWRELKAGELPQGSDEWFNAVQKRRSAYYRKLATAAHARNAMPLPQRLEAEKLLEKEGQEQVYKREEWFSGIKAQGDYRYHPLMKRGSKDYKKALEILRLVTGSQEFPARVDELYAILETPESNDGWVETLKRVGPPPVDRERVFMSYDLEVAAPLVNGRVDTGPLSHIIEVGYQTRGPAVDPSEREFSALYGLPQDAVDAIGTGAEHIHHITPEMIEGKPLFADDLDEALHPLRYLSERDGILVGHNVQFELSQLRHSLPGFAALESELLTVDTRDVCRYFFLDAPTNTNEDFVKATGGVYGSDPTAVGSYQTQGAHRALADAHMTLRAFFTWLGEDINEW